MNVIVFDLEWNQPVNGQRDTISEIPFEVIEIGAVKFNFRKGIIDNFSELIKPTVYKDLHYIIRKIVNVTNKDLKDARVFRAVQTDFLKWCGKRYIFCTWGELDLLEIQRNMNFYRMKSFDKKPFAYLDAQKLFSICFEDGKSKRTLSYAVDYLGIEKELPFHRAHSDAYYTAKVLEKIDKYVIKNYVSYDTYTLPQTRKDEIRHRFPNYYKYISRIFENKTEALADKEVCSTDCYICKKKTKPVVEMFTNNGKQYYNVYFCKKHGFQKSKIRVKKVGNKGVYIVKTMKMIKREAVNQIKLSSEKKDE